MILKQAKVKRFEEIQSYKTVTKGFSAFFAVQQVFEKNPKLGWKLPKSRKPRFFNL